MRSTGESQKGYLESRSKLQKTVVWNNRLQPWTPHTSHLLTRTLSVLRCPGTGISGHKGNLRIWFLIDMQLCHKVMLRSFARSSVKHLPHCDEIHTDDCPRNKQRSPRAQFEYHEECSARKVFAARYIRKLGHGWSWIGGSSDVLTCSTCIIPLYARVQYHSTMGGSDCLFGSFSTCRGGSLCWSLLSFWSFPFKISKFHTLADKSDKSKQRHYVHSHNLT